MEHTTRRRDARFPGSATVVISMERLYTLEREREAHAVTFAAWDNRDVFSFLPDSEKSPDTVRGMISFVTGGKEASGPPSTAARDIDVFILVGPPGARKIPGDRQDVLLRAFVREEDTWRRAAVAAVPLREEIFSRHRGILENGVLKDARVLGIGAGSVGCVVYAELARCGVGHWCLFDPDRLEAANIARHLSPIPHIGRFKVYSMCDVMHDINPDAAVRTFPVRIDWSNIEMLQHEVRRADLIICAADDRDCRVIVNQLAVAEGVPCVFGGARRRGYGLQALVVRPGRGPCYQDFLRTLPGDANDQEISTSDSAERVAYSDRPLHAEPGLSLDLAPLSTLMAKLGLHELLRGKPSMLHCLDEDLEPALYWFLNRREPDTPFSQLPPMGFDMSGLRVLRWFGIPLERNPRCFTCGDFLGPASVGAEKTPAQNATPERDPNHAA